MPETMSKPRGRESRAFTEPRKEGGAPPRGAPGVQLSSTGTLLRVARAQQCGRPHSVPVRRRGPCLLPRGRPSQVKWSTGNQGGHLRGPRQGRSGRGRGASPREPGVEPGPSSACAREAAGPQGAAFSRPSPAQGLPSTGPRVRTTGCRQPRHGVRGEWGWSPEQAKPGRGEPSARHQT